MIFNLTILKGYLNYGDKNMGSPILDKGFHFEKDSFITYLYGYNLFSFWLRKRRGGTS